jgi:hypothetical protein
VKYTPPERTVVYWFSIAKDSSLLRSLEIRVRRSAPHGFEMPCVSLEWDRMSISYTILCDVGYAPQWDDDENGNVELMHVLRKGYEAQLLRILSDCSSSRRSPCVWWPLS